jgi:LCP family protein required for cell wall assembly
VNDPTPGPPEYKVYRSRRKPLARGGDLDSLRKRLSRNRDGDEPRGPRDRPPITPGRVLKWVALAIAGWLLLSVVLFLISAQTQDGVSDSAKRALSSEGSLLSGTNILVLGSDARTGKSIDESQQGPSRADTIMLVHAALGSVRKLSIPRDSYAEIPGHTGQKINAAYALGGPSLMIRTVEGFMGNGIKVSHLIEVDFKNFPALIDSLGGIDVTVKQRICSPPFDNFWKGLTFRRGEQHLNGERALGYARIRKNSCAPNETDIDRARRQQEVLTAIKGSVTSPGTFFRLPLVSWRAPRAIRTDMKGPSLLALFTDLATGSSDETMVLEPSCLSCGPGGSLVVSEGAKADAARKLTDG